MKQTTITIINDGENRNLTAFEQAAKLMQIVYTLVSPKSDPILNVSVKHNSDEALFVLGCTYQHIKSK
jgi:hypothetical protein